MAVIIKKKAASTLASEAVLNALKKQHGELIGKRGGKYPAVERIPIGVFPFDLATGGGVPRSRVAVFYGPENSGKSLNMYLAMLTVQRQGQTAVLIDVEHVFDEVWAKLIGIDVSKLIVIQPDTAEQAVDAVEAFLYAKDVGIVGVDSLSAFTTDNEVKSGAEKQLPGGSSAIVGKMIRKSVTALSRERKTGHNPSLLCISQIRMKIGQMMGNPETFSGGNGVKYASSLTVRFYGKNKIVEAVSMSKPTFKYVQGVIQKYRIPVVGTAFEYDQCIIPHGNLRVGQAEAWGTVESFLKSQGQLAKAGTKQGAGWNLFGHNYKTLDVIKEVYRKDDDFKRQCERAVTLKASVVEEKPVVKKAKAKVAVDEETGEITE